VGRLGLRQRQPFPVAADLVRRHIQLDTGKPEQLRARTAAPQQRPQPGPELLQREWLGQVVIRAGVQPGDPVRNQVSGGQHQDRGVIAARPDRAAHLKPARFRHEDVEHDGLMPALQQRGQRGGAVGRRDTS
jgi:hypothetical protein